MTYEQFFARHQKDFVFHNWARVRGDYTSPVAIYFGDDMAVMRTPDELVVGMKGYSKALRDARVGRTVFKIDAVSLPRKGRQTVWVSWHHHDVDDQDLGVASAIYYFALRPGADPLIEMVSYEGMPQSRLGAALVQEMKAA